MQLREDLGEAIGRVNQFAKLCGLRRRAAAATILEWEDGYGPIGPVTALLSLQAVASDHYPIGRKLSARATPPFTGDDARRDHFAGSVDAATPKPLQGYAFRS